MYVGLIRRLTMRVSDRGAALPAEGSTSTGLCLDDDGRDRDT